MTKARGPREPPCFRVMAQLWGGASPHAVAVSGPEGTMDNRRGWSEAEPPDQGLPGTSPGGASVGHTPTPPRG